MTRSATFLAALLISCATASAATLTDISGNVLVNKGEGFLPAAGKTMELSAGDIVMTDKAGSAKILCDQGNEIPVNGQAVVRVDDCGLALGPDGVPLEGALGPLAATPALVFGGVAVAATVGVIAQVSSSNDTPASP